MSRSKEISFSADRADDSVASWGTDSQGRQIAFVPGPRNSSEMSLELAAYFEQQSNRHEGDAGSAMRQRADLILDHLIYQEAQGAGQETTPVVRLNKRR